MFRIRSVSDRIRIPVFRKSGSGSRTSDPDPGSGSFKFCESILLEYAVVICWFIGKRARRTWFYSVNKHFQHLRLVLHGSYYEFLQKIWRFKINPRSRSGIWVFRPDPDPDPNLSKYPDPIESRSETLKAVFRIRIRIRDPPDPLFLLGSGSGSVKK